MTRHTTILFVDDTDALREVFTRLLEREGYRVVQGRSGTEGLIRLADAAVRPALIISDIVLPGPDGREFVAALAVAREPVLLISGYPREEAERRLGISGGGHFLAKPFGAQQLLDKVRELIGLPDEGTSN